VFRSYSVSTHPSRPLLPKKRPHLPHENRRWERLPVRPDRVLSACRPSRRFHVRVKLHPEGLATLPKGTSAFSNRFWSLPRDFLFAGSAPRVQPPKGESHVRLTLETTLPSRWQIAVSGWGLPMPSQRIQPCQKEFNRTTGATPSSTTAGATPLLYDFRRFSAISAFPHWQRAPLRRLQQRAPLRCWGFFGRSPGWRTLSSYSRIDISFSRYVMRRCTFLYSVFLHYSQNLDHF